MKELINTKFIELIEIYNEKLYFDYKQQINFLITNGN